MTELPYIRVHCWVSG